MKRSAIAVAAGAVAALVVIGLVIVLSGRDEGPEARTKETQARETRTEEARACETRIYEVLNTVQYRGESGRFSSQAAGTLAVQKEALRTGNVAYTYAFTADVSGHEEKANGELRFPPVTVVRDPRTERFVGGHPVMKQMGFVANLALDQVEGKLRAGAGSQTRSFSFAVPSAFPGEVTYQVRARRETLDAGASIAALAVSEPFMYAAPGEDGRISARHRVLCVLDAAMDEVLYQCSSFTATASTRTSKGTLRIESLMVRTEDGEAVALDRLDKDFSEDFRSLDLAEEPVDLRSETALPTWAMHSVAVRDAAGLVAAAAIEGKPNFAITATVGLVLLADAGVSAATGLLQEAGVIDWEWDGIPNYAGQGVGLVAARAYEEAFDEEVDEEAWKRGFGIAGDMATLFIPTRALAAGATFAVKGGRVGLKTVKGVSLAGKSLRVSKHGMDIVGSGKGWLNSRQAARQVKAVRDTLTRVRAAAELGEASQPPSEESTTGRRGEGRFQVYTQRPFDAQEAKRRQRETARALGVEIKQEVELAPGVKMTFVLIPAGTFMMGSNTGAYREKPVHTVNISKPFYIAAYEITMAQWTAAMGTKPWAGEVGAEDNPEHAVSWVSWNDCQRFIARLNAFGRARGCRLPTEAEWEYCCRAGASTEYCFGDDEGRLGQYAWYEDNADEVDEEYAHPVGRKKPNAWGLYDMHGNVLEWCQDWYGEYPAGSVTDPTGPAKGSSRVLRGGSWVDRAHNCRVAYRDCCGPGRSAAYIGFRPVLSPAQQ